MHAVCYVYLGVPMKFIRKFSTTRCSRAIYTATNLGVKCVSSVFAIECICLRETRVPIIYCSAQLQYILIIIVNCYNILL